MQLMRCPCCNWSGRLVTALVLVLAGSAGRPVMSAEPAAAPLVPFVLPWDDASPGAANVSAWLDHPAGKLGPVVVRDGHLFGGSRRLRLLGVNFCFGASFPRHEDAEKVAARLAKFGVNAVRFHHMDMHKAPDGIFAADRRTLDPEQLDRLDYLIARLKEHGIYGDLNLHVSRTYPGMPTWEGGPSYHKGVDNFVPAMIEWQHTYARDLLWHVNPYTKSRYADEPAVALVEINNENALFQDWWGGRLDDMPAVYAGVLQGLWNGWLGARYPDFGALKRAWGVREASFGAEMLENGGFAQGLSGWRVEVHGTARAEAAPTRDGPEGAQALRVDVAAVDGVGWHVQVNQPGLKFRKGEPYTLVFQARADGPRRIAVDAKQAHAPYQQLWSTEVPLSNAWRTYRFTFQPDADDDDGRITLSQLGERTGALWFAAVSLRPGGVAGLVEGDAAGRIAIVRKRDFGARTPEAQRDWIAFLWETERSYWTGMARFLKDELKVRCPIVGTQMGWSPAPIQAELDAIDSHAYWQHPRFPGRGWDPENWTVQNIPMAGVPDGGTLPRLALARVAGKPFLCTEYNHSAPNVFGAETIPLIGAFAALQDWDGVFLFAYSHRHDDWDVRRIPSFFDIDQHPAKMATLPAAAAMFLRGDVRPLPGTALAPLARTAALERVLRAGPYLGADAFGVDRRAALEHQVGLDLEGSVRRTNSTATEHPDWRWGTADGRRTVLVDAPRSKALIGEFRGASFRLGDLQVAPGRTRQDWAVLTFTALDGADFAAPGRILITAMGVAENTAMGWKNPEHTSVGRDWGRAPSVVEGIAATITLPSASARTRAWALDERGQRRSEIAVRNVEGHTEIAIGPAERTIWYEVEVGR
jgi:hypothetical protein